VRGWNDIREFEAQEGRMTTVWIYVDTSKEVGDVDHLKVFATAELADILFDALIVIGPCAYVRRPTFPAGPVVQVRIIVCLLLLTTIVVAVHYGLRQLADSVDLATFLAICGAAVLVEIGIGFTWDRR
jgi:hypothetical protein